MAFRVLKFITGVGHLALSILLVLTICGITQWQFQLGFVIISLAGFNLTMLLFPYYLERLEDRQSLRMIFIPMFVNVPLTILALVSAPHALVVILSMSVLALWGWMFIKVRMEFNKYFVFGRGSLPDGIWLNPPVEALQEGDFILVHGPMADKCRNAVGHADLVVRGKKGRLHIFTSLIEKGTIYKTARALLKSYKDGEFPWVVVRLREPLTEEQGARSIAIIEDMLARNKSWVQEEGPIVVRKLNMLPLPAKLKQFLVARWAPTGYDHFGKFWGGERKDRWTCIAAGLHVLRELGVPVGTYGSGAFGLFGEFNPYVPVRLLRDPAYRWLTEDDKGEFKNAQNEVTVS